MGRVQGIHRRYGGGIHCGGSMEYCQDPVGVRVTGKNFATQRSQVSSSIHNTKQGSDQFFRKKFFESCPAPTSFLNKNDGPNADSLTGYDELCDFSLTTLRALIEEEENGPHGSSSLSKLCRLDIGIMRYNNECHYFVSEVERTVGVGIFGSAQVTVMAQHLARVWQSFFT